MTNYTTELDFNRPLAVANDKHAHHTGWVVDPDDVDCYGLTLHDEHDRVLAVAFYTYEHWVETFERLKSAHEAMLKLKRAAHVAEG